MPISNKSIIAHIRSRRRPFTYENLLEELVVEKRSGRNVKKKKTKLRPHKEQSRIEETMRALTDIGLVRKIKKSYELTGDFKIEGVIKTDSRGNAVVKTDSGDEFTVKKEFTGVAHTGDVVEAELTDYRQGVYYASVVKILKRKRERYIARVENKARNLIFYRLIDVPGNVEVCSQRPSAEPRQGDLALVQLTGNTVSGVSECEVEEMFSPGDEAYDVQRVIVKHSLPEPHKHYRELDGIDKKFLSNQKKDRKDYRKLFTVTIDGEYAKDFDDAISLEILGSSFKLYVHIADVSAFVNKGSELDREAAVRGTSFYLGNRVIPMLPEMLSNDLCSLKEGVERLTLTAEMTFDERGVVTSRDFHPGIIKSDKRLTYAGAHEIIESSQKSKLALLLRRMHDLARILKEHRMRQGRLDLNIADSEFTYEGNALVDLVATQRLKSHLIIEEFMLSANETVSKALREHQIPTLYRIHENISEEKLQALQKFLNSLGLTLKRKTSIGTAIQEVIDRVRGKEYEEVVNFIILKSLMQAYYGVEPLGHFGLGFRDYTHFTSPIRRYPDLVVHRCLKNLISKAPPPFTREELAPLGEKNSTMERVAQNAERDLFRIKSCRYMSDRVGEEFNAIISGIGKSGFFVTILEKPIEGMVPLRFLTDDYYLVQEDDFTVIGKRLGRRFRLGDRIRVRLVKVEIETTRIDFEVV